MAWATIDRAIRHGRPVVVKATDYDAGLEANGLLALAAAGAPVPEVLEVDTHRLVITDVDGPDDWEGLGRCLALCHRMGVDAYGYHLDNVLGPLPQTNPWTVSWSSFYADQRLRPHLDALPAPTADRIRTAIADDRLHDLLEHGQSPALIHGDLWSGNVVGGHLIDPAVHYADRELDLAFAAVFGGIPARTWEAYREVWPLDEGWERRRPALQLYHLLVHVRLFGASYVRMVEDRLDTLGW